MPLPCIHVTCYSLPQAVPLGSAPLGSSSGLVLYSQFPTPGNKNIMVDVLLAKAVYNNDHIYRIMSNGSKKDKGALCAAY